MTAGTTRSFEPPQELADYLLGPKQSWQLADAGWSPDFPTSAQDALRLYTNESGDARIDGVIGITTYTIDELLKVTGPITVPGYSATIAPGETTLKVLQLTRVPRKPGENAKAFLPVFADRLFASLLALPSSKWGDLLGTADAYQRAHLLLAWFRDPADQALVARTGLTAPFPRTPATSSIRWMPTWRRRRSSTTGRTGRWPSTCRSTPSGMPGTRWT